MTTPVLTQMEVAILQALDPYCWVSPRGIAEQGIPLHPDKIRRKLHKLEKLGMVERYQNSIEGASWWQRTKLGDEAAKQPCDIP